MFKRSPHITHFPGNAGSSGIFEHRLFLEFCGTNVSLICSCQKFITKTVSWSRNFGKAREVLT